MLNLSGKDKIKIAGLVDYKNLYIEKELASGDKTLAFLYPKTSKFYSDIEEECYITTKEDEFIVKEKNVQNDYTEFKCILNLEDLEGKPWERYASEEQTIDKALALALAGTGWIVGKCSLKKKRTVRATNVSSLDVIQEIRKTYRCDLVFNTLTKTIDVYERLGEDKGTYFIDSLNLKNLAIQGNSYNFFTRIIPIGKDNLRISSINNGKDYLENYQYSNKVKTYYWIDERYTIVENLKEDAAAKLDEISKPYRAYVADIINLAKLNDKYKDILDFKLGDTVNLISKDNKFRDKQRIVKIIEHPDEHELDSVEIANTTLSFEEKQTQFEEASETVNNITTDNGTIDGSTVDEIHTDQIYDFKAQVVQAVDLNVINAKITNLEAHNVNITGRLNSVEAHIGTLETNVATIDRLTVTHSASINDLQANKASITQLEVVNASIKVLEANVGKIETLVNGNLSSENIQAGGITSDKLTIANGFIKNAMIDSLDVSKVNAGDISTNKFRIKSDDGGIEIVGATQQFKDKNNKIRIQMGKDSKGNFNFIIIGEDGTSTLIDHTGVKAKAIADDLIVNNMIASDAVGEKQINYSSFSNGFNKDTNTTTLKASKIKLDNQNQSLEVAFNSLKTQADGTKSLTESHSTNISVIQGQINTAINNTQIVKDGQTILLKDDYNRTVQTVNSMNSTLGSHSTKINEQTGKIENVNSKVNAVERDLNSITARVSSTETSIVNLNTEITTTKNKVSSVETNLSSITSRVSSVETTTSNINDLAKAMGSGKMLNTDAIFKNGTNGISAYNNAGNNTVTLSRISKIPGCPTTSTHCLEIKTVGPASPNFGGFYFGTPTRANAIFITKIIAKIPVGRNISWHSNEVGIGSEQKWLTPTAGTNKWEEYICQIQCGIEGTFSTTNYFTLKDGGTPSSATPLVWYIAYATVIDITDNDESITNLTTRMSAAEQKITDSSIITTVSSQFYKKGETDTKYASQTQITQLSNQISSKVDVNGVKSIIQQNPSDVRVGFNGISNSITMSADGLSIINRDGVATLDLKYGALYARNWKNGTVTGTYSSSMIGDYNVWGLTMAGTQHSGYMMFGRHLEFNDNNLNTIGKVDPYIRVFFDNYGSGQTAVKKGVYIDKGLFVNGVVNCQGYNIENLSRINFKGNNRIYHQDYNFNHIVLNVDDKFELTNQDRVMITCFNNQAIYSYADWNFMAKKIVNANIHDSIIHNAKINASAAGIISPNLVSGDGYDTFEMVATLRKLAVKVEDLENRIRILENRTV